MTDRAFFLCWFLTGFGLGLRAFAAVLVAALLLAGCGPSSRPSAPPAHVPVRVLQGDEGAVREAERAYLAAGLPPLSREIRVRVLSAPGISPPVLPAGSAGPGALGGTWLPSGDVDVSEPRWLPHELLHAAFVLGGDPSGDSQHRDPRWALLRVGVR